MLWVVVALRRSKFRRPSKTGRRRIVRSRAQSLNAALGATRSSPIPDRRRASSFNCVALRHSPSSCGVAKPCSTFAAQSRPTPVEDAQLRFVDPCRRSVSARVAERRSEPIRAAGIRFASLSVAQRRSAALGLAQHRSSSFGVAASASRVVVERRRMSSRICVASSRSAFLQRQTRLFSIGRRRSASPNAAQRRAMSLCVARLRLASVGAHQLSRMQSGVLRTSGRTSLWSQQLGARDKRKEGLECRGHAGRRLVEE